MAVPLRCGFTWMFSDASLDDLSDVFKGLSVVLQAVVTQGDVVGQRCEKGGTERQRQQDTL